MIHLGLYDRLVYQLRDKNPGKTEQEVQDLAKALLVNRGHMTEDGELTEEGIVRENMGAAGRAIDRKVKEKGGNAGDYTYNPRTNSAIKRK